MEDNAVLLNRPVRKQIAFDLSDAKLKIYYPHHKMRINPYSYKKAWSDIGAFMRRNGFIHRQYSVYISLEAITSVEINSLVKSMLQRLPWTYKCFIAIDVTDIGDQYELLPVMEDYAIGME